MKTNKMILILAGFVAFGLLILSCTSKPSKNDETVLVSTVNHPEWSKNANIYEVNVRQFTPEGTFAAFAEHLDRLQEMGVDILWFMPISPIGELNRKGTLGSYYSIKDYTAINPEFGTMEDFKNLVAEIHERGMYVILDWVANHTALDHHWTLTNPEFFVLDEDGNFTKPNDDWTDVIQLDVNSKDMWNAMIGEMKFWIEDVGIDGFRCDVAYLLPTEFWNKAVTELEEIKPVFMLAEAETPELHKHAFEAGYGWKMHHVMNNIASGQYDVSALDEYFFEDNAGNFPVGAYKMHFITNHDENSWAGTEFTRLGDGVEAFAVFTATIPGMILIYSGQEAGFDRMLEFFEKDQIDWNDYKYHDFYQTLLFLKGRNKALWNGLAGGPIERINTNHDKAVFSFVREKDNDKVFVVLNLSDSELEVSFSGERHFESYTDAFTGEVKGFDNETKLTLGPWAYRVFEK
jgi:glycosidase